MKMELTDKQLREREIRMIKNEMNEIMQRYDLLEAQLKILEDCS